MGHKMPAGTIKSEVKVVYSILVSLFIGAIALDIVCECESVYIVLFRNKSIFDSAKWKAQHHLTSCYLCSISIAH